MFTKFSKFLSLLVMVAMLTTLGAGAAFAQDLSAGPGSGPGNAVRPTAGTVEIAPGTWQWYAFRSQVPVTTAEADDTVGVEPILTEAVIDATLRVQSGNLDFEVWSANDLNNWINNTDFNATGAGSINEEMTGDPLFWQGAFTVNSTMYLIVMNRGSQAANYNLDITGNVAFPTELVLNGAAQPAVAQVAEPVMSTGEMALTVETPAAATTSDAPMMAAMATGPESAVMPAAGNVEIAPGTWQWYKFTSQLPVNVDAKGKDVTNVTDIAEIDAILREVSGNVDFEIWSADDLNNWINSTDFEPTGAGTTNESLSGDPLFWQGAFTTNNGYYLIVMNRGSQPAIYNLSMMGDVSFPSATSLPVK